MLHPRVSAEQHTINIMIIIDDKNSLDISLKQTYIVVVLQSLSQPPVTLLEVYYVKNIKKLFELPQFSISVKS